jgi:hypothetical protein
MNQEYDDGRQRRRYFEFEQLSSRFHLPLRDAAKELNTCTSLLKKVCRRYNLLKWPRRQVCRYCGAQWNILFYSGQFK